MIKIKLVGENAKAPVRANPTDAGADLFSTKCFTLYPMAHEFVDFGFQMEIPDGFCGLIFPRSGLGSKYGIRPRNCVGVIDSKYRGNVGMMVENHSNETFKCNVGDRIAQLVIVPISLSNFQTVSELETDGDRGGGFGSTGK